MQYMSAIEALKIEPYPAQEEAIMELASDKNVILSTPTGSGKSLVAQALHFKGLCEDKRSFYTCPIKALVSEKFFVCHVLSPNHEVRSKRVQVRPASPVEAKSFNKQATTISPHNFFAWRSCLQASPTAESDERFRGITEMHSGLRRSFFLDRRYGKTYVK